MKVLTFIVAMIALATEAAAQTTVQDKVSANYAIAATKLEAASLATYQASHQLVRSQGTDVDPGKLVSFHSDAKAMAYELRTICTFLSGPNATSCAAALARFEASQHNVRLVCILRGVTSCSR